MRRQINAFIMSIGLLSLVGCGGGGSSSADTSSKNETITVSLKLPAKSNTKGYKEGQYKSFASDVTSVLLQVYKAERVVNGTTIPAEKLNTKAMTKESSTGIWSIDLILNPDSAPFDFKALAYQGAVTTATETDNTPIFIGETADVSSGDAVIVLTETEESVNDSIRKLPSLSSVGAVINDDESLDLTFNLSNEAGGVITYALSSVANDGGGAECSDSLFTPSTGSVDFSSATSFTSKLVLNEANCASPKHFLTMTTGTNDTIKVPFSINATTLEVNIAFPPVIENINIVDNDTSFGLDVVVTDSDSLTLTYAWSVVVGTGTFDSGTASATNLSGFNRESSALEIIVVVTNSVTGSFSSIRYQLITFNVPAKKSTVLKTGQIKSFDTSGSEIANSVAKDDGHYQTGVTPSYTKNNDNTVTDNITKLVWQNDSNTKDVRYIFSVANTYCENSTFATFSDWRLPTRKELQSLVDYSAHASAMNSIFNNISHGKRWSSTPYVNDINHMWISDFDAGDQMSVDKTNATSLTCVRTGA